MKIIEIYTYTLNQLISITNDKIEAEAETELIFTSRLFKKYFGQSLKKEEVFGKFSHYELKKNTLMNLKKILKERSKGIPIQYILDEAWFYGHNFHVYINDSYKTLIPRNETEIIVEKLTEYSKERTKYKGIDIGTGTCCIPISLILNTSNDVFFDAIDPYTFKIAKKNISKFKLEKKITPYNIGIEEILNNFNRKYDIVTANLPYIPEDKKIKELIFEPKEALYAKDDGLHYIKIFFNILPNIMKKNGVAFIEIDPEHADFLNRLKNFEILIFKDLNNLDRIAKIKIK